MINEMEHYIALRVNYKLSLEKYQAEHNKRFFLSMAPLSFMEPATNIKSENIVDGKSFERLRSLKNHLVQITTASKLNDELLAPFDEEQKISVSNYLLAKMI